MAQVELIMPKMGESIMEATILKWVKNVGDTVELDETILEIATDKVDSEIPSPVAGTITKILFKEDDVVDVGKVIAIIATEGEKPVDKEVPVAAPVAAEPSQNGNGVSATTTEDEIPAEKVLEEVSATLKTETTAPIQSDRFYSPLVRNIAKKEGIGNIELEQIPGTGKDGRVTKSDMVLYLKNRQQGAVPSQPAAAPKSVSAPVVATQSASGADEIIQMDRMRKMISEHMVMSKRTSAHVTSYVEADVTNLVEWRNRVKNDFQKRHGEKITFTPIFLEAVAKTIAHFPMINVSVDGNQIIVKKSINIGMAAALPSGNLIVPVIKQADQLNLVGLTKTVNDLANRARNGQLKPDEIQGGTFTLTNVGTFGNVMGTPIINQPEVAVLAVGAIRKKPAVVETEYGDLIAIRHMMFLSLSYDHRVVDGFLGGSFLRKVADHLEAFDKTQTV